MMYVGLSRAECNGGALEEGRCRKVDDREEVVSGRREELLGGDSIVIKRVIIGSCQSRINGGFFLLGCVALLQGVRRAFVRAAGYRSKMMRRTRSAQVRKKAPGSSSIYQRASEEETNSRNHKSCVRIDNKC